VLLVIICCLTIQVSACLFGLCKDKKNATKETIVLKTNNYHEQTELILKTDQDSLIPDKVEQDNVDVLGDEKDIIIEKKRKQRAKAALDVHKNVTGLVEEMIKLKLINEENLNTTVINLKTMVENYQEIIAQVETEMKNLEENVKSSKLVESEKCEELKPMIKKLFESIRPLTKNPAEIDEFFTLFANGTLLGKGSFGQVKAPKVCSTEKNYCMKRIESSLKEIENEFVFEVIAYLHYPKLFAKPYGYVCQDNHCIIFFEKYEKDLSKVIKNYDQQDIVDFTIEVLDALKSLYIIHSDLKVENIFTTVESKYPFRLGDFGYAKLYGYVFFKDDIDFFRRDLMTNIIRVIGTPICMSPLNFQHHYLTTNKYIKEDTVSPYDYHKIKDFLSRMDPNYVKLYRLHYDTADSFHIAMSMFWSFCGEFSDMVKDLPNLPLFLNIKYLEVSLEQCKKDNKLQDKTLTFIKESTNEVLQKFLVDPDTNGPFQTWNELLTIIKCKKYIEKYYTDFDAITELDIKTIIMKKQFNLTPEKVQNIIKEIKSDTYIN